MAAKLSPEKLKPALREAILGHLRREEKGGEGPIIRIVKCSTVLSDYDNLVGGYKALLDQLRKCGAIAGDDPRALPTHPDYQQIKVATKKEVGTWLEITIPD